MKDDISFAGNLVYVDWAEGWKTDGDVGHGCIVHVLKQLMRDELARMCQEST